MAAAWSEESTTRSVLVPGVWWMTSDQKAWCSMNRPTLDQVREWLVDLATAQPTCEQCTRRNCLQYGQLTPEWEMDALRHEFVRRCSRCATSKAYPWAASLDPARVADWLAANAEPGYEIDLDRMHRECADRGGFSFL